MISFWLLIMESATRNWRSGEKFYLSVSSWLSILIWMWSLVRRWFIRYFFKFALFIVNNEEDVWHVFLNYYLIKPRRLKRIFRKLFIRLKNLGNRNSDYILVEFERAASNSIQNFNHSFNPQPFTNTTLRWLAWLIGFYGRIFYNLIIIINTARKVSNYGVFSGPYFPLLRLNTGKYGPEKTPYLDAFHVV